MRPSLFCDVTQGLLVVTTFRDNLSVLFSKMGPDRLPRNVDNDTSTLSNFREERKSSLRILTSEKTRMLNITVRRDSSIGMSDRLDERGILL
jgi:hypothetical protein